MTRDEAKRAAADAIERDADHLVALAEDLHARPEVAWREHAAVRRCAGAATGTGLAVRRPAFGVSTSFAASGGRRGPLVVLCAEYDALPGLGHACGHNLIAAAAVGAARALAPLADRLAGRVRLVGCPAEERGGGKVVLAGRGAFDGANAVVLVHPSTFDASSPRLHAAQYLDVECHGRAAHAALAPERGVNALDALVIGYQGVANLRSRLAPADKVHGIVVEGGEAPNIVPAHAAGTFILRCDRHDRLPSLAAQVGACFEAGGVATGAGVELRWRWPAYLPFVPNAPLAAAVEANLRALGRDPVPLDDIPAQAAGSTDLGNISHLVPCAHPFVRLAPPSVPLHTPGFSRWATGAPGVAAVLDGAKLLAATTIDVWSRPALRSAMRRALTSDGRRAPPSVALGQV
ncbi:MAG: amidohydrolase, partial [Actinomycetota bacterium]|nr:amidohydrolase [Actinomycetota bacterium]